ncbi:MAG: S1 RNA-binding domain-containing protein [SAR202 cluster bacterium]|nr:S1 RNA-binding domain-containing protein [SAR202 cluster bacterium]MQF68633.1 S1 RNA-binding domain-containing protein [SAR202 cluster bacterium AD-802-K11_MRT_200m]MQG74715.1 S1 RNA-binding domain-containing protein [SAR202 cluster bacterium]
MPPTTQDDSPLDMQQLLDEMEFKSLRRGEIVEGTVMRADPEGIYLDIGHKEEGFIPPNEMRTLESGQLEAINEGDPLIAFVIRPDSQDGPILSIDKAKGEEGWRDLQKYMEADETIEGKIIGFNRGGCILEVANVQGFVPMSQLVTISHDNFNQSSEDAGDTEDSSAGSEFVGSPLTVKVLEVNRSRNRAIFSERSAMREQREAQKAALIEELHEGEIRKGRVTGISNFGAFVDLGGADGLIHISELSWGMVNSPEEIVNVGQELDVYVLRVDRDTMKIALSLRRMQPEPWDTIYDRYQVGDVVSATVTKLADFGAFARLEDSIEGLIHVTELTNAVVTHPREVVSEGDAIKVKILRIEMERKRLGLSLKQADETDSGDHTFADDDYGHEDE